MHLGNQCGFIGGCKKVQLPKNGWFAARPFLVLKSVYKIYAKSFLGETHLQTISGRSRRKRFCSLRKSLIVIKYNKTTVI